MRFIADLHIHSFLSRATSPKCDLENLAAWAKIKGIHVVGTGDFTHPKWLDLIESTLTPAEPGFMKIKKPGKIKLFDSIIVNTDKTRFVLSAEISSIYKKNGKTRKNHNLIYAPDIKTAKKISRTLGKIGNITSDGRPILGLDAKNLLEIVLGSSDNAHLIPAHIWTPWFSLFGSKSGFDSIEECFEDLSPHIFALETGLSSDPSMNWMLSKLDRFALISNSDAHSPQKLGREANIFDCSFDYFSMFKALKEKKGFIGTIEFYPEEGKYHLDGHRKCNVAFSPEETFKNNGICPKCKKPLTVGVLNRVSSLADRKHPVKPKDSKDFFSLIPLIEILSEIFSTGVQSKKIIKEYMRLLHLFPSEFDILLNMPLDELKRDSNPLLRESILRMRIGNVYRSPGYDGEFGRIKVFTDKERKKLFKKYF